MAYFEESRFSYKKVVGRVRATEKRKKPFSADEWSDDITFKGKKRKKFTGRPLYSSVCIRERLRLGE